MRDQSHTENDDSISQLGLESVATESLVLIVSHTDTWTLLQLMQTNKSLRRELIGYSDVIWSTCHRSARQFIDIMEKKQTASSLAHTTSLVYSVTVDPHRRSADGLAAHPVSQRAARVVASPHLASYMSVLCALEVPMGSLNHMYRCAYRNILELRHELNTHFHLIYRCVLIVSRRESSVGLYLDRSRFSFAYALREIQRLTAGPKTTLKAHVPSVGRRLLKYIYCLHDLMCAILQTFEDVKWVCKANDVFTLHANVHYISFRRITRRLRYIYTNLSRTVYIVK